MSKISIILILIFSSLFAQIPKYWNSNRPYWDMPVAQDDLQVQRNLKKTLDYQLNPFHQPNEIYGKETSHGGGSYDDHIIGQTDVDAANAGTDHFALDATGNNIINSEDATEIQNYVNKTISYLQSHWNFLSENEKLSWFTKMANIYTVDQKQYIEGDESTRYISGNFATEFALRMQGYDSNKLDFAERTRKPIPDKYSDSFDLNGRPNIPVYFVVVHKLDENGNAIASHGMNGTLKGNDPRVFNNWEFYDPQVNLLISPGDSTGAIPLNSNVNIYKFENFGGSSWGEDMPSPYLGGDTANTMNSLVFNVDSNGKATNTWTNQNLLTTKPTVAIGREANVPKNFSLGNNYPNPFNPTTQISYDLSQESEVELIIYNSIGEEVNTIINKSQSVGSYTINWNGLNSNGEQVPGGIYFYPLKTNDFTQTKKCCC